MLIWLHHVVFFLERYHISRKVFSETIVKGNKTFHCKIGLTASQKINTYDKEGTTEDMRGLF